MNLYWIIVLVLIGVVNCKIKDYCEPKYCPNAGTKHSACETSGKFASDCEEDMKIVKFKAAEKQQIVDLHNFFRDRVANGDQPLFPGSKLKFPSSRRMMKLVHSEEQAFLASLQLKTCKSHDACHNTNYNETTKRLLQAGQNIFWEFHGGEFKNNSQYITSAINAWFNEYQVTPIDVITSLFFPKEYTVGHFTQIIHDRNTDVGCSMVHWTKNNGKELNTRLTCNYVKANYLNQPVYVQGEPCSGCNNCDLDDFSALCID